MCASEPDPPADLSLRPGDFARILLANSGMPPRARARDQQADLAGEALRQQVLNRLVSLDPDPADLEDALLSIVAGLGEPAGPTRGICTAIRQEWEMARISPDYWNFLIGQALRVDEPRSVAKRDRRPE
jgi:hypothetical protein